MGKVENRDLLRVRLAISQKEFAAFLGVTRSQLTMHEQGLRTLPTDAFLKMGELEKKFHNLRQLTNDKENRSYSMHPHLKEHHERAKKTMNDHAKFCAGKKNVYQQRLDKMTREYENAETWSLLIDNMLAEVPDNADNDYNRLWLTIQKNKVSKKILRCGIAAQTKLQATIHALNAESDIYKKLQEQL